MGKTIMVHGFPATVSAESVKVFLERHTRSEGTIDAIKIRHSKGSSSRKYAIVQFTTADYAECIVSLANQIQGLWYGSSYVNARYVDNDIIPKPRSFSHNMEDINLKFGCQFSNDSFAVLWGRENVSVKFGSGMRRLHFFFAYRMVEYKLDLFYENIWQIQLHCPRGQNTKYLLIQLYGAPRIYKKEVRESLDPFESPVFNFFKDTLDDQWVRETDFTPLYSIGQSSGLCLELPQGMQLPNFKENFPDYKNIVGRLNLLEGTSFSSNMNLVPIVSPNGIDLPYKILFIVNRLVQHGYIPGSRLDLSFYRLVDPRRVNIVFIEHALEKIFNLKECCFEPSKWISEEYKKYLSSRNPPMSPAIPLDTGLVYVRRVQVTPCKVYFCGPEVNVSNRVLRNYIDDIDNFLRVSFVDEELDKLYSIDLSPRSFSGKEIRRTGLYNRILSTLKNGIRIGDKKFEFLAFSSSQLRENSAWMFASRDGLSAADIRNWMGDFREIKNVAKYAARLGQSFGSSTETLSVERHEIEAIPDVEITRGETKYIFSDGIGKISAEFAKQVAKKCGRKDFVPSCYQIRYGGYKGVVAIDPTAEKKLSLRKSMRKYESTNTKLDVLAHSKYQPCFLNRQIITLLSTLGVPDSVFERKQQEAVTQLNLILTDPLSAREALDLMYPGENSNMLKEMLLCGYKPDGEPFLSMMLQTFRASKLLDLRTKTRMFLKHGRSMMGCLDETRTLEYGQVFVQFSASGRQNIHYIVQGKVVVAKNPCLHPGDVRVLEAVDVPALYHMVDCVVFPQKGSRPHPNECSGSDLDGDIYFICWDQELIPPKQIPPMDYTSQPTQLLDHDVTIEEVEEYFVNYIVNDTLGIIANAHTVFADKQPDKAMSDPCLQLAQLFSVAVDFPKTGIPAVIPRGLFAKEYPDFMEKSDKTTYVSTNVIGKLFREVKELAPHTNSIKSFTREVARESYDLDMEVDGFEDYLDDAFYHKSNYDYVLGNQMDYYGIETEAEILSGNIMSMAKSFTKRRDAEAISMAVKSLRKEARSWFNQKKQDSGSEADDDDVDAKASAWYHVTYHPDYWGCYNEGLERKHFLSFAWCVYDKLVQIKKRSLLRRGHASRSRPSVIERSSDGFEEVFYHRLNLN